MSFIISIPATPVARALLGAEHRTYLANTPMRANLEETLQVNTARRYKSEATAAAAITRGLGYWIDDRARAAILRDAQIIEVTE